MSTNEEKAPLGAAPHDASSQTEPDAATEHPEAASAAESAHEPQEDLSPAVRRLVRQFDLDITGIHGTGPSGRIRVGDVMGLLGGRTDSGKRDAPTRTTQPEDDAEAGGDDEAELAGDGVDVVEPLAASTEPLAEPAMRASIPTTTVFDCDLSRVLAHRKKLRRDDVHLLTTSYVLTALAAALDSTPEITAGHTPRFGVSLTTPDGEVRSTFLDTAAVSWDSSLSERVRAVDAALRANLDADLTSANLLVHHYGESGSLLATPMPIGAGHVASIGIGRVRREIAIRVSDGIETPRVTSRCFVTLSFFADEVPLHHANRTLAAAVETLELWPE
jgi:pyruvate/2-oxoglutarate dehydrogenase complex dihydrolipoamide acyltransferase (E2) component